MKEPFVLNFPPDILKDASHFEECPDGYTPVISYAKASYMVAPQIKLLKQLYSGSNIFNALLHLNIRQTIRITYNVREAFVGFFYVLEGDVGFKLWGQSELVCITQGTCFITYMPAGEYPTPLLPGKNTIAYMILHRRLIAKIFDDYPELQPTFKKLLQNDPDPALFHQCNISRLMQLQLRKMGNYLPQKLLITESTLQMLFGSLLEAQLQQLNGRQYTAIGRMEIAIRVFEYIRHHAYLGPLPKIEQIAEMHHIGQRTLLREFKQRFGFTLNDFINTEKMDAANYMLAREKLSVAEVSQKLGYADVQSFSRSFKAIYNYSPAEAKKYYSRRLSKNAK